MPLLLYPLEQVAGPLDHICAELELRLRASPAGESSRLEPVDEDGKSLVPAVAAAVVLLQVCNAGGWDF